MDVPTDTNYCTLFPTTGGPGGGHSQLLVATTAWCRCLLQNEGASWKTTRGPVAPRVFLTRLSPDPLLDPCGVRYVPMKVVEGSV